ncbi:hypothetical protein BSKO_11396 [Bryopsis sp. KO-2023]|nr:hypothetical protein BSKO_11396 [Bryopsis sp. KO-2023]
MAAFNTTADLTGTSWRDELWLQFNPLNATSVLRNYFALSPFYDVNCNNEKAKMQNMDFSNLPSLAPGIEYVVQSAQEPHLYVIKKQYRHRPNQVTAQAFYYVHTGTIYQAPTLHSAVFSRWKRCAHSIQKAFRKMQTDLDTLLEWRKPCSKPRKESVLIPTHSKEDRERFKEGSHILMATIKNFPAPEVPALMDSKLETEEIKPEAPEVKKEEDQSSPKKERVEIKKEEDKGVDAPGKKNAIKQISAVSSKKKTVPAKRSGKKSQSDADRKMKRQRRTGPAGATGAAAPSAGSDR